MRLVLLLAAALTLSGSNVPQPPENIRVATFNCEFLVKKKVHIKFGKPFNLSGVDAATWDDAHRAAKFTEAVEAVADFVKTLDADVLVLTEVGNQGDFDQLRARLTTIGLNYAHSALCKSTDSTTGQHVGVLSKRALATVQSGGENIIPGRECYDEELDDPETEKDTGISKGLHVTFTVKGQTVHLFGVHLASERNGHEQDQQRIAQASIVRRDCLKHLKAGEHVIVAGDLNDRRGEPTLRRIRGRDDIYGDLIQTGAVRTWGKNDQDRRWTYVFQGRRQQIDHVLISRSIKNACTSGGVKPSVPDQANDLVSDHRPFVVDLRFR